MRLGSGFCPWYRMVYLKTKMCAALMPLQDPGPEAEDNKITFDPIQQGGVSCLETPDLGVT
jgi:hypothetical protein